MILDVTYYIDKSRDVPKLVKLTRRSCVVCNAEFIDINNKGKITCSSKCTKARRYKTTQEWREKNADEYRRYQREVMRTRRAKEKLND